MSYEVESAPLHAAVHCGRLTKHQTHRSTREEMQHEWKADRLYSLTSDTQGLFGI